MVTLLANFIGAEIIEDLGSNLSLAGWRQLSDTSDNIVVPVALGAPVSLASAIFTWQNIEFYKL